MKYWCKLLRCLYQINFISSCISRCATKLPQLQKYLLVWYEYNETKKELDHMLRQQRQQLDSIVYHLEVDLPKHQPNVQNDLRVSILCFCFFFGFYHFLFVFLKIGGKIWWNFEINSLKHKIHFPICLSQLG